MPCGLIYFKNLIDFIRFCFELGGKVLLNIEVVSGISIGQILVVRVLGYIKLVRHERTHTAKLQDALAAIKDSQFIDSCKVLTELLIIE